MADEFLTVDEVASTLKVNPQTVRNWIDRQELPAVRAGRRVRIRQSDLDAYLVETSRGPEPEAEPDDRELAWSAFATAMSAVAATAERRDIMELKPALEALSDAARVLADALNG